MVFKNIIFSDLKLIMAGSSLAAMCKNYGLEKDESKKEIELYKMATLSIATRHREEIEEYVLYDVISMLKLYNLFIKNITKIALEGLSVRLYNEKYKGNKDA